MWRRWGIVIADSRGKYLFCSVGSLWGCENCAESLLGCDMLSGRDTFFFFPMAPGVGSFWTWSRHRGKGNHNQIMI